MTAQIIHLGANLTLPSRLPPPNRRRSDRRHLEGYLFKAFHDACDDDDLEVARQLLDVVEARLNRNDAVTPDTHRTSVLLVAAYERLWALRH